MDLTANDTDVEDTTLKIVKIENVSYGTVVNNGNGTVTISANGDILAPLPLTIRSWTKTAQARAPMLC